MNVGSILAAERTTRQASTRVNLTLARLGVSPAVLASLEVCLGHRVRRAISRSDQAYRKVNPPYSNFRTVLTVPDRLETGVLETPEPLKSGMA
jgi:hypothetical protein